MLIGRLNWNEQFSIRIGTNFIGTFILNFVFCLLLSAIEYAEMNNKKKLNNGKINLKKEVIDVRVYKIEILALD